MLGKFLLPTGQNLKQKVVRDFTPCYVEMRKNIIFNVHVQHSESWIRVQIVLLLYILMTLLLKIQRKVRHLCLMNRL